MAKRRQVLTGGTNILGKTKEGRPIVGNDDGSVSTEQTITVDHPEGYINIPTMFGGKKVSPDEAIDIIKKSGGVDPDTGRTLPTFKTVEEAETEAQKRTRKLGEEIQDVIKEWRKQKGME